MIGELYHIDFLILGRFWLALAFFLLNFQHSSSQRLKVNRCGINYAAEQGSGRSQTRTVKPVSLQIRGNFSQSYGSNQGN
jgi:hypothetical protein